MLLLYQTHPIGGWWRWCRTDVVVTVVVVRGVVGGGGDDVGMILGGVGWRIDDDGFGVAVVAAAEPEMEKVMRWCEDGSGSCLEISPEKMSSERKGASENIYKCVCEYK
uniref:Uncharacterized protein n=1 Tax=Tanacetum cinerariifolium TaxID=118510 RepID=A0A699IDY8_TANCI|nr:hypothetical protein [Tanacetum cinerariifolium]